MVYCLKRPSMIFPCAPRISFPDPFSPLLHFSISFTFQWHSPSTLFSFYVCTYFSGLVGRPYMGGYISAQLWYCRRCLFISANPHFWRVVSFYKDLTFSRFCYPSISTCGLCVATFSSRARVAGNESWLKNVESCVKKELYFFKRMLTEIWKTAIKYTNRPHSLLVDLSL